MTLKNGTFGSLLKHIQAKMASQVPKIDFEKMFSGAILRCSGMKIQSLESNKHLGTIQRSFPDHMKHFEKIEKNVVFFGIFLDFRQLSV